MQSSPLARRQRFNNGFVAGLVAGLIASGLMLVLSVWLGGVSLPEVFGSALLPDSALSSRSPAG